jgi:hypothetical protein
LMLKDWWELMLMICYCYFPLIRIWIAVIAYDEALPLSQLVS